MMRYVTSNERIGRVGQRRQVAFSKQANGVLIKPKRVVDPDDVLTPAQAKKLRRSLPKVLLSRARRKRY